MNSIFNSSSNSNVMHGLLTEELALAEILFPEINQPLTSAFVEQPQLQLPSDVDFDFTFFDALIEPAEAASIHANAFEALLAVPNPLEQLIQEPSISQVDLNLASAFPGANMGALALPSPDRALDDLAAPAFISGSDPSQPTFECDDPLLFADNAPWAALPENAIFFDPALSSTSNSALASSQTLKRSFSDEGNSSNIPAPSAKRRKSSVKKSPFSSPSFSTSAPSSSATITPPITPTTQNLGVHFPITYPNPSGRFINSEAVSEDVYQSFKDHNARLTPSTDGNGFRCSFTGCGKVLNARRYFLAHFLTHQTKRVQAYGCGCGAKFSRKQEMDRHIRTVFGLSPKRTLKGKIVTEM
ncbi:hypothetical protein HDU97_008995 [Phlyctochytrium planicorne]|nr:hypothetical protein HDU97_008995 [Phlyctochytrium planicorne]